MENPVLVPLISQGWKQHKIRWVYLPGYARSPIPRPLRWINIEPYEPGEMYFEIWWLTHIDTQNHHESSSLNCRIIIIHLSKCLNSIRNCFLLTNSANRVALSLPGCSQLNPRPCGSRRLEIQSCMAAWDPDRCDNGDGRGASFRYNGAPILINHPQITLNSWLFRLIRFLFSAHFDLWKWRKWSIYCVRFAALTAGHASRPQKSICS